MHFQKISSHRRDWNFWGVGGSVRPKNLKKCMKLNWSFQRGGGVLEKNPFHGGGMDIFWNYILNIAAEKHFSGSAINMHVCTYVKTLW